MTAPAGTLDDIGGARPGVEWADGKAMLAPRVRTWRQRLALLATALLTGGGGYGVWMMTTPDRDMDAPLRFHLERVDAQTSGLDFRHTPNPVHARYGNLRPLFTSVSAGACTGDYDRNGLLDLLLLSAGNATPSRLFRGVGPMRWSPERLPALAAVDETGFPAECLFVDVDNDGWDDVFISGFGRRPQLLSNRAVPNEEGKRMFHNVTESSGLPPYMNGFGANFLDVENDGDLDLVIASFTSERYDPEDLSCSEVPGAFGCAPIPGAVLARDREPRSPWINNLRVPDHPNGLRTMANSLGNATNGGDKRLLLGDGHGHFQEVDPEAWGLTGKRFTWDVGVADVDLDGFTDVYFANDFGPDQLFINRDGERFEEQLALHPGAIGNDASKGMNADFADVDHDGFPELYVTNVFHPALPEGNYLCKNLSGGDPGEREFTNVAFATGSHDSGWGWGAKFVDLDLDGERDLVVADGFISQHHTADYWFEIMRITSGLGDLMRDATVWGPMGNKSLCGHQSARVFVAGEQGFVDRAVEVGIEEEKDDRGVLIGDFDVDGRPDVMMVVQGDAYPLHRNTWVPGAQGEGPPSWIGLRLEGDGKRVNRNAIGTRVRVDPEIGLPQYFEVSAGNGFAAGSMRWLVAGLGDERGPVEVWIRWPDGTEQRLEGVEPGRYHDLRYPADQG